MSLDDVQQPLFDDPIGLQLKRAREKNGLSLEQAGQQLKLPLAIVEAMEREDWPRLGAPLYVRSYLGSYLRLLGLPASLAERVATGAAAPKLVTMASRSRMRHTLDRSLRNLVYLVMTAVLVVPVVLVVRHFQAAERPVALTLEPDAVLREAGALPEPADVAAASPGADSPTPDLSAAAPLASDAGTEAGTEAVTEAVTEAGAGPGAAAGSAPPAAPSAGPDAVMASIVPAPASGTGLVLEFRGESWIEVLGEDGQRIERGLVAAGQQRRYAPGQAVRITLGNADAVQVNAAGRPVDLAPFRSANVARFAVSSSGEIATPAR